MQNTSTFDRLRGMAAAHAAAFGAEHPLLSAAIQSGDEGVALAAIAHVEKTAPKETVGLAAISREISESKTPLDLWLSLDIARPTTALQAPQTPFGWLQGDARIRSSYNFRREVPTNIAGEPIAFRLIVPATSGVNADMVEALGRVLKISPFQFNGQAEPARAALIAAATIRATK